MNENQSFFKYDEVMLDWLNVIELGVRLDTDDEVSYGGTTQEQKIIELQKAALE